MPATILLPAAAWFCGQLFAQLRLQLTSLLTKQISALLLRIIFLTTQQYNAACHSSLGASHPCSPCCNCVDVYERNPCFGLRLLPDYVGLIDDI